MGLMRSSLLSAMVALSGLAGCASVSDVPLTPVQRAELVGNWRSHWNNWGYSDELSLYDDGSFCAITYKESRKSQSHGNWSFDIHATGLFQNDSPIGALSLEVVPTDAIDGKSSANVPWYGEAYKDEEGVLWLADDRCPHCGRTWHVSMRRPAPHADCTTPPETSLP